MKLWEVIKQLEENPNKRFINTYSDKVMEVRQEEGFMDFTVKVNNVIRNWNLEDSVELSDNNWQEVKQPVTWQEAIEAWVNGGKVKCILHGESFIYDSSQWKNMYSGDGYLCDSEILNGTWYIED